MWLLINSTDCNTTVHVHDSKTITHTAHTYVHITEIAIRIHVDTTICTVLKLGTKSIKLSSLICHYFIHQNLLPDIILWASSFVYIHM